mgnify:CR=1 FL=1
MGLKLKERIMVTKEVDPRGNSYRFLCETTKH